MNVKDLIESFEKERLDIKCIMQHIVSVGHDMRPYMKFKAKRKKDLLTKKAFRKKLMESITFVDGRIREGDEIFVDGLSICTKTISYSGYGVYEFKRFKERVDVAFKHGKELIIRSTYCTVLKERWVKERGVWRHAGTEYYEPTYNRIDNEYPYLPSGIREKVAVAMDKPQTEAYYNAFDIAAYMIRSKL